MNQELISIIVPVYNSERYLAACLDSILTQSYQNLEIIVVNDGSSDFSLEILKKYEESDDRLTVYSQENSGPSEARNIGLSVATGNLITFVDSDDMLLPHALEELHKVLIKHGADLVAGDIIRDKIYEKHDVPKKFPYRTFTAQEAIADALYQKTLLPSAWGILYRRSLFEGLNFEKGIIYEDLNLFYKIFEKSHKIIWIDFPVYFYRDTEDSLINTWKPQRLDVLKVTENLEKYISEKYPDLIPAAKDRRLSANFNMFILCNIHGEKQKANECWDLIKNHRKGSLFNPKVRFKNKAGILLSYLGKNMFKFVSRRLIK